MDARKPAQTAVQAHAIADESSHVAQPPVMSLKQQREHLREGRIVGFRCAGCGHERFSPMARCTQCKGATIQTRDFSRTGTVVGFTIQSVASEAYLNETPFAFAVIQLDDGPTVSGWIPWIAKEKDLALGQKVEYVPSYKPGMQFEKR